jgi:hypothetical protein
MIELSFVCAMRLYFVAAAMKHVMKMLFVYVLALSYPVNFCNDYYVFCHPVTCNGDITCSRLRWSLTRPRQMSLLRITDWPSFVLH